MVDSDYQHRDIGVGVVPILSGRVADVAELMGAVVDGPSRPSWE